MVSVTSSIYAGHIENGRRYPTVREGYWGPSDEKQWESMEAVHAMHVVLDSDAPNPLFHSPIPETAENILDVGTGNGVWAKDVADRWPKGKLESHVSNPSIVVTEHPSLLHYLSTCTVSWPRRLPALEKRKTFLDLLERLIMAQEHKTSLRKHSGVRHDCNRPGTPHSISSALLLTRPPSRSSRHRPLPPTRSHMDASQPALRSRRRPEAMDC